MRVEGRGLGTNIHPAPKFALFVIDSLAGGVFSPLGCAVCLRVPVQELVILWRISARRLVLSSTPLFSKANIIFGDGIPSRGSTSALPYRQELCLLSTVVGM